MAGERVQRYELVEQIGLGGMAEVYRARQVDADGKATDVVIKKILPHLSRDPQYRTMFIDEAKIASTLRHPNIVHLLELGDMDGLLFLALEFVDGADGKALLSRALEQGITLEPSDALYIAREVLKGLHYAHIRVDAQGVPMQIVHRDVSPQNVFLSRRGEAKLGDFGIATAATRGGKTIVGVVKGNPLYMAPEQVRGGALDARTDVYAAGLLLLALLCGRHPAEEEPLAALLNRALNAQVPRPSDVNRALPEAIDLLVLRATMLDPAHRYQSALEFAQAIDAYAANNGLWLDPKPISALIEALFPARHPASEDALPPVMVGTLAAEGTPGAPVIVEGVSVLDASDPRLPARTPPPAAAAGPGAGLATSSASTPAWDDPLLAAADLGALFGRPAGERKNGAPLPPWEAAKAKQRPPTAPWEKAGAVPNLAPKPAGDTRPSPPAGAAASATPAARPSPTPRPSATPPPASTRSAAPSSSAARKPDFAFGDEDEDESGGEEHTPAVEGLANARRGSSDPLESLLLEEESRLNADRTNPQIPSAAVIAAANAAASGASAAAPADESGVEATPEASAGEKWEEVEKTQAVKIGAKGPDRTMVSLSPPTAPSPAAPRPAAAPATAPRTATAIGPAARPPPAPLSEEALFGDGFFGDDAPAGNGGAKEEHTEQILDDSDEEAAKTDTSEVPALAPVADEPLEPTALTEIPAAMGAASLAAPEGEGSADDVLVLGEEDEATPSEPARVAKSPFADQEEERTRIAGSASGLWSAPSTLPTRPPSGAAPRAFTAPTPIPPAPTPPAADILSPPPPPAFAPPAPMPGFGPASPASAVPPAATPFDANPFGAPPPPAVITQPLATLIGHRLAVTGVTARGESGVAVSSGHDKMLRVWDLASWKQVGEMRGHASAITCCAMTPDGSMVVSGSRDKKVILWDLSTRESIRTMEGHTGWVFGVDISDDGRVAASASQDKTVRVWDFGGAEKPTVLQGHKDAVASVALFDDGRRLVSGSYDKTVRVWALDKGIEVARMDCEDAVRAVAVSPDGMFALSAGADSRISLWDLVSGERIRIFSGHNEPVVGVAFSPDGRFALSGAYDGAARIWDVQRAACLAVLVGHTDPVMSVAFAQGAARALTASSDGTVRVWATGLDSRGR